MWHVISTGAPDEMVPSLAARQPTALLVAAAMAAAAAASAASGSSAITISAAALPAPTTTTAAFVFARRSGGERAPLALWLAAHHERCEVRARYYLVVKRPDPYVPCHYLLVGHM